MHLLPQDMFKSLFWPGKSVSLYFHWLKSTYSSWLFTGDKKEGWGAQALSFISWILLRLCALIARTSSKAVAVACLCNVMGTGERKADRWEWNREDFCVIYSWYDEQDENGFRKALICGLMKGKYLRFLTDSRNFENTHKMLRGCLEAWTVCMNDRSRGAIKQMLAPSCGVLVRESKAIALSD